MLKISLDESFVFDLLSILDVKMGKASGKNYTKVELSFEKMSSEIIQQIGKIKYEEIISSCEYESLFHANGIVFDLVDKAKQDNGIGKEMDNANYMRYLRKTDLQKKFFDDEVSEVKIGYN